MLRFSRTAKADLVEARRWYRRQAHGLDTEFLRCFEACLSNIDKFPDGYPLVHERVRRASMRRFPCAVFYTTRGDTSIVLAVWHTGRDPDPLRRRLG